MKLITTTGYTTQNYILIAGSVLFKYISFSVDL